VRRARVRVVDEGAAEASLAVPELAGVWLRVRAAEDRALFAADDEELARWLVDDEVLAALALAREPDAARSCDLVVDDEAVLCQSSVALDVDAQLARLAAVVESLAARPAIVAARWRQVADAIGGTLTEDVWPLAPPVGIRVVRPRGEATVSLRYAASPEGGRDPWLRTVVQAPAAPHTPAFALARTSPPRARKPSRPPSAEDELTFETGDLALRGVTDAFDRTDAILWRVAPLLAEVSPSVLHAVGGLVSVDLDGEAPAPAIDRAIDLAITLAVAAQSATGPYR
jgi:hypothetical protein